MCGCDYSKPKPADTDRGWVTLTSATSPNITAKNDICGYDELSSQPTSPPLQDPTLLTVLCSSRGRLLTKLKVTTGTSLNSLRYPLNISRSCFFEIFQERIQQDGQPTYHLLRDTCSRPCRALCLSFWMAHQPLNVAFDAQNHLRRDWLQVGTVLPAINRYVHVSIVGP